MDLNKVMLIGRVTTDLEVKKVDANGSSVLNFSLATNRRYKNKEGNLVEEAEFHRCVAFGTAADLMGKYLEKGKKTYIEGRLRTRKWEDSTGTARYTTEIVVENFIFLDNKGQSSDTESNTGTNEEDLPF